MLLKAGLYHKKSKAAGVDLLRRGGATVTRARGCGKGEGFGVGLVRGRSGVGKSSLQHPSGGFYRVSLSG
jgi:hypothetical protein